jgi:chloramphenicol 3-O phosphotransferase
VVGIDRPGRVVILNGASSAGKTTIAHVFCARRAARGELWLPLALDDFHGGIAANFFGIPGHEGAFADDGIRFEEHADELRVVVGPAARRVYEAYHRAVAACARHGVDLVVDEVVIDRDLARDWQHALEGLWVHWVAVRCAPDELARREAARGDRALGLARGLSRVVHEHVRYDLEIDTTRESADSCAQTIERSLDARDR